MNTIIPLDIFDAEIMVHFGEKKELRNVLAKYMSKEKVTSILNAVGVCKSGLTLHNEDGTTIIYIPQKPSCSEDFGTISHEIFHAVSYVMKDKGIDLTDSSEEVYAYTIGFVTRKLTEIIFVPLNKIQNGNQGSKN